LLIISLTFSSVVNAQEPRLVLPIGHTGRVNSAIFSPNGKHVLTAASFDNSAKIWDVSSGRMLTELSGHLSGVITAVYSPNGKKLLQHQRTIPRRFGMLILVFYC
jgi:WD40 repeat protein